MKKYLTLFLSFFFVLCSTAQDILPVFPKPQNTSLLQGKGLSNNGMELLKHYGIPVSDYLQEAMEIVWTGNSEGNTASLSLEISTDPDLPSQGYDLLIRNDSISINASDKAGIFYAWQTLQQLSVNSPDSLPQALSISDYPDFPRRGYMLDISRDKVPTMNSLYELIDLLANLKYNELQLYTEHTFAYRDHEVVWENASPMTPEQIKELDRYCKIKNIDLVPNQNSFGHMERWLEHDAYLHLAECPDNCNTVWGLRKRHSLNPTDPGSLELMQSLYEELLPNFSSEYFNIGCDETIELGLGRSAARCRELGKGQVYLNYLKDLHAAASSHGKKVQFWGDIILNHPDLIEQLPADITALVWGYSDNYPFNEHLPKFKKAGIDYYVCPGTSSWRSLIGRNHNGFLNLENAARNGIENGAKGFLLTDWGDHGHWQPAVVSLPSIVMASSLSWNQQAGVEKQLPSWMDLHIFKDAEKHLSDALLKLGDAYTQTGIPNGNANIFHLMLHRYGWTLDGNYQTKEMTLSGLEKARTEILEALEILQRSQPMARDGELIKEELEQAAKLALHGIRLGMERLEAKGKVTANIPLNTREELASELDQLITRHKELWIKRNRPGGLEDSAQKLEDIKDHYLDTK